MALHMLSFLLLSFYRKKVQCSYFTAHMGWLFMYCHSASLHIINLTTTSTTTTKIKKEIYFTIGFYFQPFIKTKHTQRLQYWMYNSSADFLHLVQMKTSITSAETMVCFCFYFWQPMISFYYSTNIYKQLQKQHSFLTWNSLLLLLVMDLFVSSLWLVVSEAKMRRAFFKK